MFNKESKILFIVKKGENPSGYGGLTSGLFNSVSFIVDMLKRGGYKADMEQAIDANCIDRLVTQHKADIVIIEALWVVPAKFKELEKLHKSVKWVIKLHSEPAFLANEGIAIEWLREYEKYNNVFIATNSKTAAIALQHTLHTRVLYFPNYYPVEHIKYSIKSRVSNIINRLFYKHKN